MAFQFIPISSNAKTGPIPQTYSERATCPPSCPHDRSSCYAHAGYYTRLNWDAVTRGDRGGSWSEMVDQIGALHPGTLWRHNIAGDLPGDDDRIDSKRLRELTRANTGKRGFTYTHYPVIDHRHGKHNRRVIRNAIRDGFAVNVSADRIRDAIDVKRAYPDLPVAVVVPSDLDRRTFEIDGVKFAQCPATYRQGANCMNCKLCAATDREVVVTFPAHGKNYRQADIIARSN